MNAESLPKAALLAASDGSEPIREGVWCFDRFELDLDRGELRSAGTPVALRPKSFALLRHLVAHSARLVSKDELLDAVWPNVVVTEDSVTQCVGELRSAMGDQAQLLKTVPRRGYILDAPVHRRVPATKPIESESLPPTGETPAPPVQRHRRSWLIAAGLVLVALAGGLAAWWWPAPRVPVDSGVTARRAVAVLPFGALGEPPSPALADLRECER